LDALTNIEKKTDSLTFEIDDHTADEMMTTTTTVLANKAKDIPVTHPNPISGGRRQQD
jgi:hypothetical protein